MRNKRWRGVFEVERARSQKTSRSGMPLSGGAASSSLFPSFFLLRGHTSIAERATSSSDSVSEYRKRENVGESISRGRRAKSFFFPSSLPHHFDFPFRSRGGTRPRIPDSRRHNRIEKNAPCTPPGARHCRHRRHRPRTYVRFSEVRPSSSSRRRQTTMTASSACPGGFASASAGSPRRRHGAVGLESTSSCGAARRLGAWPARRGRFGAAF